MRNTLRVTAATAAGALAFTMLASTAQADEDDPTPSDPTITAPSITAPATVDRLMPIEVNGTDFDQDDKVTVVATQVSPDEGAEAFTIEQPATVNAAGNIPRLPEPEPGQRVFVEVPTDNSWPIGDYKVQAEIVGDDGETDTTAPVNVSVKRGTSALGVDLRVDGETRTKMNTSEKLSVGAFWPDVPADTKVSLSLHRPGMTAPVTYFEDTVAFENDALVDNAFELSDALRPGPYMVQFQVESETYNPETEDIDYSTNVFARTGIEVVAPPPPPDPKPEDPKDPTDPEDPKDPEPEGPKDPEPEDPKDPVTPQPQPDPRPENPRPQTPEVQKPTTPPAVNEVPATTKKPAATKKNVAKVQTPDVIVGSADGDSKDMDKATEKQGEVDAPEAADPRASIPGESELEASPKLTFGDEEDGEVTLSAAPKSESVPMTPLLLILGLMAALGTGAAFVLRKFRV